MKAAEPILPADHLGKPIANDPKDILRTWLAFEVLSPQSYRREVDLAPKDAKRIARLDPEVPWGRNEKAPPMKKLHWELVLGAVELAPAVEALLKVYADDRPDKPSMQGRSPIATILLGSDGRPLEEENAFAISSFAWGAPAALAGSLELLAEWPDHEERLLKRAWSLLPRDENNELIPLTKRHIEEIFEFFRRELNLGTLEVKEPYFALLRYEHVASKNPERLLLNSFYLEDLATAIELAARGSLPRALRHYLGLERPVQRTDLLSDAAGLQNLLQPSNTPLARWPARGRFPLTLLQQAAVNAADEKRMSTGVLAVNGPPGTGKSTLLRDVVAARIVERAEVMSTFENPSSAFEATDQSFQRSGAKITLYRLDPKLKGFEMVVASSNNKAVENVSAELPGLKEVADDAPGLRYFKAIADLVFGRQTWGLVAAVLGKSSNRYAFSQRFWRDPELGLSTYLNHASGVPQVVSEKQDNGELLRRPRKVVDLENPPANAAEARVRWVKAREEFVRARDASQRKRQELQRLHELIARLGTIPLEATRLRASLATLQDEENVLLERQAEAHPKLAAALEESNQSQAREQHHAARRPGLIARLLRTSSFRVWSDELKDLSNSKAQAAKTHSDCQKGLERLSGEIAVGRAKIDHAASRIQALEQEEASLEAQVRPERQALDESGAKVPDLTFLSPPSRPDIQTATVWFDNAARRLREDLFEAAIRLHRAFNDCAADPLRQNLSIFVESFGTRPLGSPKKDALIADLWSSFFLVVPVVSTTFASVHRMFSRVVPETLGWLLVDEAGQATPQAVVGTMTRTRRAVVVGDPLQVEPVVTLPNTLTEAICRHFGVEALRYNAPEASVQTVADAASSYCARFPSGSGYRDVGAPLLVHRRCDSPMFDVSNEIAYSNLMVQAKAPPDAKPILGKSRWIDVKGTSGVDKWCPDEGAALIDMLWNLRRGGAQPDLYVVTPFVIVQDSLRDGILRSRVLHGWAAEPCVWVDERVGTVHTVQGREADVVFFVLGAQGGAQGGARLWAGGRPNLVNVAVTRAKSSLYVIGNRELWRTAGVFATLDRYLP